MEHIKYCTYRLLVFILIVVNFMIVYTFYFQNFMMSQEAILFNNSREENTLKDFLIYNTKCRIPNLDPWNREIRRYYKKRKYIPCADKDLLSYVTRNGTDFILHINENALISYSFKPITCCYMNVSRSESKAHRDSNISTSKCANFKKHIKITENAVKVTCRSTKQVYSNAHAAININKKVQKKLANHKRNSTKMSVFIIGIDSISRLNFIRALPKTRSFLLENEWIEYKGYNKMGENTFPNLMAILTGRNLTSSYKNCTPTILGALDKCNFIWKDFDRSGYITSYAEDEAKISTFNFDKKGFNETPVDYYFRPYMIAAHTLTQKIVDGMTYCTGPEMSGERILNLAKEFSIMFRSYPYFGFFWMNSFSHNDVNSPTRMDTTVLQFFEDISEAQILENCLVIFTSDHGIRFGELRKTRSGWLEERLPFLYFWLPKWFKINHPSEYDALKINSMRLTTPYDLHMTLQHVLFFSDPSYIVKPSQGCPKCKSLFKEVDKERSCEDAGIQPHWCTCTGYENINQNEPIIIKGANFILNEINKILTNRKEAKKCAKFKLRTILSSSISSSGNNWYKNDTYLLIILRTVPDAIFEVTISVNSNSISTFERTGGISRIDSYKAHSNCVKDSSLKPLCYCQQ